MVYYLGSDSETPLTKAWNEDKPAFYIGEVENEELKIVRGKLPHLQIKYLGSHQGCGCGFRSESNGFPIVTEGVEADKEEEDHEALVTYLAKLPKQKRPNQIFGCWNGDESEDVLHHRDFAIRDLLDPNFYFREREIITLTYSQPNQLVETREASSASY